MSERTVPQRAQETAGPSEDLGPSVDVAGAKELVDEDRTVLVDVRSPAEFEAEHIPGAVNVPLDVLQQAPERIGQRMDRAVLVCRSGQRSEAARRVVHGCGAEATVLDGGMIAWNRAGEQVRRGRQRWDIERQVRFVAGLLVLTGVLASLAWPPAVALSGFVGAGLVVAALTNTCTMGLLLARMPWNRAGRKVDPDRAVRWLEEARPDPSAG